jgi:hypothetical protein
VSLRLQAEADLGAILGDATGGFGWPIVVTNPAGVSATLTGFSTDVSQTIDPQTGEMVGGRQASVALSLASLAAAGFELPFAVADGASKPWLVSFVSINGETLTFKVADSNPDRAIGITTLVLEVYRP